MHHIFIDLLILYHVPAEDLSLEEIKIREDNIYLICGPGNSLA